MGVLERDLGDLVTSLGGGHDGIVRAIALHASETSDPSANLTALRGRLSELRSQLSQPSASASRDADFFSRLAGDQQRALVLDRRAQPFSRLQGFDAVQPPRAGAWYEKEIVRGGVWVHPIAEEPIEFSASRLAWIASETNRYLGKVGRIPFPDGHRFDAAASLGWWHAVWLAALPEGGQRLMGLAEVPDAPTAAKLGREIRDVSMWLDAMAKDSHGGLYHDVITHVCATPYPVIDVQTNFAALALSRGGSPATPPKPAPAGAAGGEDSMLTATQLQALGFAAGAKPTEAEIDAKLTALAAKAEEGKRAAEATALAKERDDLAAKVAAFEAKQKKADEDALEALVLEAKNAAAASGNVEGFAATEKHIRDAWGAGLKDAAQAFAKGFGAQPAAAPTGTRTYTPPASGSDSRSERIAAQERNARSMGWSTRREGTGANERLIAHRTREGKVEEQVLVG